MKQLNTNTFISHNNYNYSVFHFHANQYMFQDFYET